METPAAKFRAFILSVGVHMLCVLLLVVGLTWTHTARPLSVPGPVIEATLANFTPPARSTPPKPAPKPIRPAPAPRPEPPPEPATPPRAEDLVDREEIDRMATEQAEQEKLEQEEMRKREQELLEAEREEQLADIRRLREEAEAERMREEKKLAMIEQREQQQRDLEERERMQDLMESEATEPRAGNEGVDEDLLSRYVFSLQQIVTINWLRPDTTQPGLACTVRIVQIPGGEVLSANVVPPCNGDDLTRRSLEAAVLRAQPLPYQGYESVFQRSIDFVFRYDG